ncbi:T9SS type A sorting domain-containing protein [Flavobacterium urocaniciphilum]|uniref:Delta-60 repeat domain-containing protein/Por secretion system C-terminal sorting domain-containing protein n=1 Tax=Flavobacterium urocaniciphilum TaxID=1299341 RepID=A0A1H9D6N9_9FLAO|nr:T9SS type A sorting domain-containing protein [Flavobacterium urocaniciphilum]SEQ09017.1 delta-60 repeat domain-containing protein/Por secretion system C-terminal sorting domain-containing protein [Flavobacterium urocaniciphilum]
MIKKILLLLLLPIIGYSQQINPNFGTNGTISTDYAYDYDLFSDLQLLQNGKVLLFGNSKITLNSNLDGFAIIKYNEDGSFDNTFGINGKIILNFDSYQNSNPTSVVIQNDGKILIAGNTANNSRGVLTRLHSNGSIDTDFGFNGKVTVESKNINKMLLTPNQQILLFGNTVNDFCIEKLNSDGFHDLSFGINGITTLDDNNTFEKFTSAQILSDNSIICIGDSSNPNFNSNKVIIAKYSANGVFDSSFGIKRINMPYNPNATESNLYASDFKVLADNSIIMLVNGSYMTAQNIGYARIYKIDMNGNLLLNFNSTGYIQFNNCLGCDLRLQNVQFLDNNKFLVTQISENNNNDNFITTSLINSDGSINTTFGNISIDLINDFTPIAKAKVLNDKLYVAYHRTVNLNDYYINAYLIENQFLSITSLDDISDKSIIYPNPFSESFTIDFKNLDVSNGKISLYNINGTEIYSSNFSNVNNNTLTINELEKYATGIYFLKISSDNYLNTFKIIKK